MTIDLPTYIRSLQDLQLVEAAGIDFHLERYHNRSAGPADNADHFGHELVEARVLTRWQHQRLLAGGAESLRVAGYNLTDELEPGDYLGLDPVTQGRARLWLMSQYHSRTRPAAKYSPAECVGRVWALSSGYVTRLKTAIHQETEYLIDEHGEGLAMQQRVDQQGPLEIGRAVRVLADAAQGVAALYRLEYTPRVPYFVTPDDVITTGDGARISPLCLLERPVSSATPDWSRAANYLAPESSIAGTAPPLASVYSLGCVLCFALTGAAPFDVEDQPGVRRTPAQVLMHHQVTRPPDLRALRPETPPWLAQLCQQMMAKQPERRPQGMLAVQAALEAG